MSNETQNNKPTHLVKVRHGHGKKATYERIGAAWMNHEDESVYIRFT